GEPEVGLDAVLVAEDHGAAVGKEDAGFAGLVALVEGGNEADVGGDARLGHADGGVPEGVGGDHDPAGGRVGQEDAVLAVGRGLEEAGEGLGAEVGAVYAGAARLAIAVD